MKTVYFVRHGETEANVALVISGGEHESPLTEKGRQQAKEAGQKLKTKHIDHIVSSPMERTRDTAQIVAKEIGYDLSKIIYDKSFIEVMNGYYSGKPYSLVEKHRKEGTLVDDLESVDEVYKRVQQGFDKLRRLPGDNIVLVSHGATGRMIRAIINKIPHYDFITHERFENGEIYEFTLE